MYNDPVAAWMSTPPVVIAPTTTLAAARRVMEENQVRRLPVVQRDRLVGIVTLGDLREAQPSPATALSSQELQALLTSVTVSECMSRDPVVVTAETPILEVAQLMFERKIGGLPVVKEGRVVGMITESDLFRLMISAATGKVVAAPRRATIVCRHCGTVLSRRPISSIDSKMVCWNCQYHVHRCENCRHFDGIACMLKRDDQLTPVPGQHCPEFVYLPVDVLKAPVR